MSLLAGDDDLGRTESPFWNEVIAQATLQEAREGLLEALRFRFPEVLTPDAERAIADQPSLPLLRDWRRAVFTVNTADEFLAVLRR